MSDCIFCDIVRGEASASIVYQDDDVTVFHDLHPQAPVHLLVVPNRHIVDLSQIEEEDGPELARLFVVARRLAEEMGVADGFRVVVNSGPEAGQSVFHLHMHVLGGRRMNWPPG